MYELAIVEGLTDSLIGDIFNLKISQVRYLRIKYVNQKKSCESKILKYSPAINKNAAIKKSIIDAKSLYSLFLNHLYKKTGIEKPPHIKMLKINITMAFVIPKKAPKAPKMYASPSPKQSFFTIYFVICLRA